MKIGLAQLRHCQSMLVNLSSPTAEDEKLLHEIKELVADARYHAYCDYQYELVQLLEAYDCLGSELIREEYFPRVPYDPSRE